MSQGSLHSFGSKYYIKKPAVTSWEGNSHRSWTSIDCPSKDKAASISGSRYLIYYKTEENISQTATVKKPRKVQEVTVGQTCQLDGLSLFLTAFPVL